MPCGGIFQTFMGMEPSGPCFTCGGDISGGSKWGLFVEEWDACIHRDCLGDFLVSEEGKVVLEHGHAIMVVERD